MPKVLLLTGDAAESLEVMYPYQRLMEEGYQVDIAAPSAKKLQFVIHDFVDEFDTYTERLGYTWPADVAFADVDPAEYVALVIPGGVRLNTFATTRTYSASCGTSWRATFPSHSCVTRRWYLLRPAHCKAAVLPHIRHLRPM